jgi:hypothetical protein
MFCIIAFVVLGILGIFSATNRQLAKEALDCVLRRVTLRPCNTGFDEKMKSRILGSVINRSETAARVLNNNFELLSWIFFVMMLASSILTVRGLYLFYTTGSCNGLNQDAFCVFDPQGANNQVSGVSKPCTIKPKTVTDLTLKDINLSTFPVKNQDSKDKIVFIGCYLCDYTRKAYPDIEQLVSKFNVNFTFADYPTKENSDYLSKVDYCVYRENPDKFWKLNDKLFASDKSNLANTDYVNHLMGGLGLDVPKMDACISNPQTETAVQSQFREIEKTNFFGTPTIFINDAPFVGPKPYRVYAIKLRGLWYW